MMLDISGAELELLTRITDMYVSELAVEIQHTDNLEFRENLKAEKTVLSTLLQRLKGTSGPNIERWLHS